MCGKNKPGQGDFRSGGKSGNLPNNDTRKPISSIAELMVSCSFPGILLRVLEEISNSRSTRFSLAKIIGADPDLTERIVHAANSPFYLTRSSRFDDEALSVSNLPVAILKIGFRNVRNITATQGICSLVDEGLDLSRTMMAHMVVVGEIARTFGSKKSLACGEDAFFAGLMHDFGKLILLRTLPKQYLRIAQFSRELGVPVYAIEKETLSVAQPLLKDHVRVAMVFLLAHRVDLNVVKAIETHHDDATTHFNDSESWDLPDMVFAANELANHIGYTDGIQKLEDRNINDTRLVELLGISDVELNKIAQESVERASETLSAVKMSIGPIELRRITELQDEIATHDDQSATGTGTTSEIYGGALVLVNELMTGRNYQLDHLIGTTGLDRDVLADILNLLINNQLVEKVEVSAVETHYVGTGELELRGSKEVFSIIATQDWSDRQNDAA